MRIVLLLISLFMLIGCSAPGEDLKKVWEFQTGGFSPDFNMFVSQTNEDPELFKLASETKKVVDSYLKPDKDKGLERILLQIGGFGTNTGPAFLGAVTLLYYYSSPGDDRKILEFFNSYPETFISALNSKEWIKKRYYKDEWLALLKRVKDMIRGDYEGFIYLQHKMIFEGDFSRIPSPLGFLEDNFSLK